MGIRWVSLYDIMFFPSTRDLVDENNVDKFLEFLYSIGFDVDFDTGKVKGLEYQENYCRSLIDPKIICHGRWVGYERTDEEWLGSKMCSLEHRIDCISLEDFWLAQDMRMLSEESNFSGAAMEWGEDVKEGYNNEIVSLLEDSDRVRKYVEEEYSEYFN